MTDTDRLSGIHAFVSAADAGNFSAAADRLHLSRSAVAKRVNRLEQQLGVKLFHRTTRSQTLTEVGQAFYARCVRVLAELDEAANELEAGLSMPVGKLRLSLPVRFGTRCVMPLLSDLARDYPRLQIETSFSDRRVDLIEEGFDLAMRSGPLPDSTGLQMRMLGTQQMVICASPAYLHTAETPTSHEALQGHAAIVYGRIGRHALWPMTAPDGTQIMASLTPRLGFDDLDAIRTAVEGGLGLARLPLWLVNDALASGSLQVVLPEYTLPDIPLQLIWPRTSHMPSKLRVLVDALAASIPPMLQGRRLD
ncbi:MAG: LysR family transcriptional regulator [Burkholderiales bacterium]|nr:LysR family transcriptional regulator [Burkholderiales bacterium]